MRIAYVLDGWPRMTETFVAREIAYVAARHDVTILALERGEDAGTPSPEVSALRGRVTYLDDVVPDTTIRAVARGARAALQGRRESTWRRWPALRTLAKRWEREGVERIHAHFARWATAAAQTLSAATQVPFGFTAHAYDLFVHPVRLHDKLSRASWAVTCTDAGRAEVARRCGAATAERVHVIRHGVDCGVWKPRKGERAPGPLRVLAVGRLVEKKGFSTLVDAAARLAARAVGVEVRIVGDGPLAGALDAQVATLAPLGLFHRLGPRPTSEVRALMRDWADVLVAPSVVTKDGDRDGIPNVVGEALACGVPVVGSAVGGIPELVIDGTSGILVPPGDSDALAVAIERLHDPALRRSLATGARRIARERFDAAKNLAAFLRVVESGGRDA